MSCFLKYRKGMFKAKLCLFACLNEPIVLSTELGLKFLKSIGEEPYPEADIYAALNEQVPILFKFHILVSLN